MSGNQGDGYHLLHDDDRQRIPIRFEPLPAWMTHQTTDEFPMAQAGVSLHGDMAVVNLAPGCEFFLHKHDGASMRCRFCSYGAPDERTAHLGQVAKQIAIPKTTYARMAESETEIRHIYLVGGSLPDWNDEATRFLEMARRVKAVNTAQTPVTLGSGALPTDALQRFHAEGLVENACFNLEVLPEELFAKVCPGKQRFVGFERWIASLEAAVGLWGRGHVYTAMVAGIELEPEYEMSWEQAVELVVQGS